MRALFDDHATDDRLQAAVRLARSRKLSIYDALYLEGAIRRSLPLASRDERLLDGARLLGLEVYDALGPSA